MQVENEEPADDDAVVEGLALYRSLGCAACHGQDGEGGTGPAIAGHTAEQVRRQVRTPKGDVMPAFNEEQLNEEQFHEIIAWVESLGPATGAHGHDEATGSKTTGAAEFQMGAPLTAHVRLALFAVKDGNVHDAEHHLEDLVALLDDEHVKSQAEDILASLQDGADLHDVEHEMQDLMGKIGLEAGEADGPSFHLQLVLDSLTLDDLETASHHLEHYAELIDDADLASDARELQAHLAAGELHLVDEGAHALLAGQRPSHQD
jgi:cytochrome c553